MSPVLRVATLLLGAVLLAGCGEPDDHLPNPRDGRSGLRLSGTVDGRQVAVSDGLPVLNAGDCDVNAGPDRDVCFLSRDVSGDTVILIIENPAVLEEGAALTVGPGRCPQPLACDDESDVAVIDVQIGLDGPRVRATGGRLVMEVVQPFARYRGTVRLELPGGRLSGEFDVVPRPDPPEESG